MSTLTDQSRELGDSQSTPLRSRMQVKPSHPDYDQHVLAHIKARVVVDPVTGCWEHTGFQRRLRNVKSHSKGYVGVGYRGKGWVVHRLTYTLLVGPIPAGLQVCHKCDNPPCCNPEHLFLGDQIANMRDMAAKKRNKAGKTHCHRGHAFAGDNLMVFGTHRRCKACDRIRQRMDMGWSEAEAISTPVIPFGAKTERRIIGVKNRGRAA